MQTPTEVASPAKRGRHGSQTPGFNGSLGVVRSRYGASDLSVVFQFPGSEGDRTYLPGSDDGWANRSHPMQTGSAQHHYHCGSLSSQNGAAEGPLLAVQHLQRGLARFARRRRVRPAQPDWSTALAWIS